MSNDGWKAPQTDEQLSQEFFAKHGRDSITEAIDRRWRTLGKLVEQGAAVKIRDGRLG